jgi:hypothetical protein
MKTLNHTWQLEVGRWELRRKWRGGRSHVFDSIARRTPTFRVLTYDSPLDEDAADRMIVFAEASTDSRSSFQ